MSNFSLVCFFSVLNQVKFAIRFATCLPLLDSVHYIEDVFMLAADYYADLISKGFQFFCKNPVIFLTFAGISYHHHVEVSLYDGLGDIKNVSSWVTINMVRPS